MESLAVTLNELTPALLRIPPDKAPNLQHQRRQWSQVQNMVASSGL